MIIIQGLAEGHQYWYFQAAAMYSAVNILMLLQESTHQTMQTRYVHGAPYRQVCHDLNRACLQRHTLMTKRCNTAQEWRHTRVHCCDCQFETCMILQTAAKLVGEGQLKQICVHMSATVTLLLVGHQH